MTLDTPYLWAIKPTLPAEYASKIQSIKNSASADIDILLDTLIRFVIGAECSAQASVQVRQEWTDKQPKAQKALDNLRKPANAKRPRDEEDEAAGSVDSNKRPRLNDPLFTLHAISTTSPVRKKVDITIDASSIQFTHPSTKEVEATLQLFSITRAFILPTRGKQKAHWTVVLISSDIPDRGKTPTTASPQQIIFGIDAVTSTLTTTTHGSPPSVLPKNSLTLPTLRSFLSHLPPHALPVLEPATSTFRSACSGPPSGSSNGVPGVEAYRAAKLGTLWFLKEGILWGESKPCEFWAVGDLDGQNGVTMVSATGRTCSVYLKRRASEADEDNQGEVCEFGMVDGKEQEGIREWAKVHLGKGNVPDKGKGKAKAVASGQKQTINDIDYNSDASDESFVTDSEDSDGSSSSDDGSDGQGSEGEAQESGDDADEGEEGDGDGDDDDDGELRPSEHPLMRPGAMPRMSRAAIDAVATMVEGDLLGGASGSKRSEISEEEDELDD